MFRVLQVFFFFLLVFSFSNVCIRRLDLNDLGQIFHPITSSYYIFSLRYNLKDVIAVLHGLKTFTFILCDAVRKVLHILKAI